MECKHLNVDNETVRFKKMEAKFCNSRENCVCIKKIKYDFFTKLKRFGVHITVDNEDVCFVDNRNTKNVEGNNIFNLYRNIKCIVYVTIIIIVYMI